ncbi:barstar family protein [Fusibacter sp. JL298sf-3]
MILHGDNFESIERLHKFLKDKLELPDYYGENLNALWDGLTAWVDLPLVVEIQRVDLFKNKLGNDASEFIQLLEEAVDEIEGFNLEIK